MRIAVSKPDLAWVATTVIRPALGPARTLQDASSVAPFQLAYTVVLPFARAGDAHGRGERQADPLLERRPVGEVGPGELAFEQQLAGAAYSEKYGSEPQPTNTLPFGSGCVSPM